MVFSLDTSLQKKLEAGASKPVYLIEIQLAPPEGSSLDTSYFSIKMCTGDRPLRLTTRDTDRIARTQYVIPNIVLDVQEVAQEIDALSRSCTIANMSFVLEDEGTLRDIMSDPGTGLSAVSGGGSRHLYGQKVVLYLGTQDLDASKFVRLGTYVVAEVTPQSTYIDLECRSITSVLASFAVKRNYRARDPYAQMDAILRHTCALVDAQYDRASVDPYWDGAPANDYDRRHLSVRRATEIIALDFLSSTKAPNGQDAWSLLQEIAYVTGGFVTQDYSGKVLYVPWDDTKAASRDLGDNDVNDFNQEVMYSNAANRVTHTVAAEKLNIEYNPYEGNTSGTTGFAGPTQQAAYFGGNNSDSSLTLENESSAKDFHISDSSLIPNNAFASKRWLEFDGGLNAETGMAFASFMMAPTKTAQGETDSVSGSTLGLATYTHSTKTVALASGTLNITVATNADYVSPGKGSILRVVDASSLAVSEKCAYKEGRISSVDNSSGTSVITLADDQVLEFVQDFGHTTGMKWEILDPEYPEVPGARWPGPTGAAIGLRKRRVSGETDKLDCQRYFYVQFAAHAGFSGANYGAAAAETQGTIPGVNTQVGPGTSEYGLPSALPSDLRVPYGHGEVGTPYAQLRGQEYMDRKAIIGSGGATSISASSWTDNGTDMVITTASPHSLLVGEKITFSAPSVLNDFTGKEITAVTSTTITVASVLTGSAVEVGTISYYAPTLIPRYAYIKLETETKRYAGANNGYVPGVGNEMIRCNLAYTCSGWASSAVQGIPGAHLGIHRNTKPAHEGPSSYTGDFNAGGYLRSCAVYRVDAESISTLPTYTLPNGVVKGGGIKPSGRAALGSDLPGAENSALATNPAYVLLHAGAYYAPQAVSTPLSGSETLTPPIAFFMGIKATDMTGAYFVNKRILDRCSYGMPVVNISTGLKHIDLELGDFVSVTNDVYLAQGKNGSDTSTIFEIVRKEIILEEDSPRVEFQLAWVRQGASPTSQPTAYASFDGRSLTGTTATWSGDRLLSTNTGATILDVSGNSIYKGTGIPGTGS
jgi:hypothetical protein